MSAQANAAPCEQGRYFVAIMPTGFWWIDKSQEIDGDYVAVAFLSFATLKLEIYSSCKTSYKEEVIRQASEYQAQAGQQYQISGSGQMITLGYASNQN